MQADTPASKSAIYTISRYACVLGVTSLPDLNNLTKQDASSLSKDLKREFEQAFGSGSEPMTEKQFEFATHLAHQKQVSLPSTPTKEAYAEFIDAIVNAPRTASLAQREFMSYINRSCDDIPQFQEIDLSGEVSFALTTRFIEYWIDYLPPREKELEHAEHISKCSNSRILTQFGRPTQHSVEAYIKFWCEIAGRVAYGPVWPTQLDLYIAEAGGESRVFNKLLAIQSRLDMRESTLEPFDFDFHAEEPEAPRLPDFGGRIITEDDLPLLQEEYYKAYVEYQDALKSWKCPRPTSEGYQPPAIKCILLIADLVRLGCNAKVIEDGVLLNGLLVLSVTMRRYRTIGTDSWHQYLTIPKLLKQFRMKPRTSTEPGHVHRM